MNSDLLVTPMASVRKVSLSGGVFVANGAPFTVHFLSSVLMEGSILFHPLPPWRGYHTIMILRRWSSMTLKSPHATGLEAMVLSLALDGC